MCKNNNSTDDEMLAMARQDRRISREELGIDTPRTQDGLETLNEGFDFLQHKDERTYRNDPYDGFPTEPEDYLKPCPFCGGKPELCSEPNNHGGLSPLIWFVACKKCGAMFYPFISDHDAIEAWNRRVGEQK